MSNNCKYLKQKLNKKLECKLTKKIITLKDCSNCIYKEYNCTFQNKNYAIDISVERPVINGNVHSKPEKGTKLSKNCANREKKSLKMSKKSKKLAKMERERESIFTDDLEHCIICGKSPVNKHEIFFGRNRQNSIIYKLVIPLCILEHHNQVNNTGIHFDKKLCNEWHIKGQKKFNEVYPDLDFVEIFKKNYLD